ncbi:hypothetical protein PC116_g12116 [Phytophthora cactorum]|nr:hypothetical protein PC116_g12116 [Phytophthora cactorum]
MPQQDDTNAAARQPRKKRKTTESQDSGTSVIFEVAQEGDVWCWKSHVNSSY